MSSQERLDQILDSHKAEPVGKGYIDIIVHRDKYRSFIERVLSEGFQISAISWWEYLESDEKESKYGMGGPRSRFYLGWCSELIEIDDVKTSDNAEDSIREIAAIIENKEIQFPDGDRVAFKTHSFLTPAFWIDVPPNWDNKYYRGDY